MKYISVDLFSGAGGMSEGLRMAKFCTKYAFEIDPIASLTYKLNHKRTKVFTQDIRTVKTETIVKALKGQTIHLLAGCPPCQGFSSIRRLNRNRPVEDERNFLIREYVRFVEDLHPYTIMLENVPGLEMSSDFHLAVNRLQDIGYNLAYRVVNVRDYGVPQSRKRLVLVGSCLGEINVADGTNERTTVRSTIGDLPSPENCNDLIHKIYPHHIPRIQMLINHIPHDGGSLRDIGEEWQLACHQADNVGFNDVYGRLRWDTYSTTITGGVSQSFKRSFPAPCSRPLYYCKRGFNAPNFSYRLQISLGCCKNKNCSDDRKCFASKVL